MVLRMHAIGPTDRASLACRLGRRPYRSRSWTGPNSGRVRFRTCSA